MQPTSQQSLATRLRSQALLGWALTIGIALVPVVLWIKVNPLEYSFTTVYIAAGTFGKIAGLVGLVLYALNLVYATRLRLLERLFGGLNRVFIAHHIVGGLALIFLCFHPAMLVLQELRGSAQDAALLLVPNGLAPITALFKTSADAHASVLQQWAVFFGIIAFWGLVVLLIVTLFIKLPYKIWLFTHKFLGAFFFIAGLHVFFVRSDTSTTGPLRWYVLGMVAVGLMAFVYKTLLGSILIKRYTYTVNSVVTINDVVSISLQPISLPLRYKPGQFIFIRFVNGSNRGISSEWHPFSIASSPTSGGMTIVVKALGDYTKSLLRLEQGMYAEIEGAYGKFTYTNYKSKKQIWIAGGIGITPFLSMAEALPHTTDYEIDLYYSVKTESELIGIDTLTQLVNMPGCKLRVIPYDTSKYGFLDVTAVKKLSGDIADREIFLCGPPMMMKSLRKQFRSAGVPNNLIHSEEFALS